MKNKLVYKFDPKALRLTGYINNKPVGGFKGEIAATKFIQMLDSGIKMEITNMNYQSEHSRKVRTIRGRWHTMGIDQYRKDILSAYGVESTTDLTNEQLDELILKYSAVYNAPATEVIRKLRHQVLNELSGLGILVIKSDYSAVNSYLMSNKIAGKRLTQLTEDELKKLVRKLHSIEDKSTVSSFTDVILN